MERNVVIILSVIVLLAFGMLFIAATHMMTAPPTPEPAADNIETSSTTEEAVPLDVTGPASNFEIGI